MERARRAGWRYAALIALASSDMSDVGVFRRILRTDSEVLDVDRVNFWRLQEDPCCLRLELGYLRARDALERGAALTCSEYPHYFKALLADPVILASDAENDERTRELAPRYLRPHGIGALMDVPVWVNGQLFGVLCHEHVGGPRAWTEEERDFALAVGTVIATAIETRARRSAEEALSESQRTLGTLLKNLPGMAYRCRADSTGTFELASEGAMTLTGWSAETLMAPGAPGRVELVHPDDRVQVEEEMRAALGRRKPFQLEYRLLAADGTVRWVWEQGQGVYAAAGALHAIEGLMLDMSSARQAELDRARLLDELEDTVAALSLVAHELSGPLAALKLQLEALRDAGLPEQVLARLERQAARIGDLVARLVEVPKLSADIMEPELRELDLGEVVSEVVQQVQAEPNAVGVPISLQVLPPVPVRGDRVRLEQVARNLLSNALKYGERKPVDVRVCTEDGLARLEVRDHGIGISSPDQERIFERFERTSHARRTGSGMGLGLWMVRRIVTAHRGRISVKSAPGEGSTFQVELPLSRTRDSPR